MRNPQITFLLGLLAGMSVISIVAFKILLPQNAFKYPVKATLYRFSINPGHQNDFNDWVSWHSHDYQAIVATMQREHMYVESVFSDTINDPKHFYWLAVEGEGGENYTSSNLEADKKHSEYIKKIVMKGSRAVFKTQFLVIAPFLDSSINKHQNNRGE